MHRAPARRGSTSRDPGRSPRSGRRGRPQPTRRSGGPCWDRRRSSGREATRFEAVAIEQRSDVSTAVGHDGNAPGCGRGATPSRPLIVAPTTRLRSGLIWAMGQTLGASKHECGAGRHAPSDGRLRRINGVEVVEGGGGRPGSSFDLGEIDALRCGHGLADMDHPCRPVPLAPVGNRCQVGRVGLDQQSVERGDGSASRRSCPLGR